MFIMRIATALGGDRLGGVPGTGTGEADVVYETECPKWDRRAAWHAPLLLFADYNAGTNRWYAMTCFAVMIVSSSFIFAWLRLKSGSLWPAAVLHASHNLFVQTVFDGIMRNTGKTLWYTTEFGVALALVTTCFAAYFWMRRAEVEQYAIAIVD
jgi:hypothetical protein